MSTKPRGGRPLKDKARKRRWILLLLLAGAIIPALARGSLSQQLPPARQGNPGTGQAAPESPVPPVYVDGPESQERIISEPDLVRLFPDVVFRHGSSRRPQVAITFDDGPDDQFTPKILDTLQHYDAPATFFIVGAMVERHPDVAERIVKEGHEIGHHGYRHVDFSKLADPEIREQLERTAMLFDQRLQSRPRIFRPPYSALNPRTVEVIRDAGYRIVLWSIDSLDWRGLKKEDILANVLPQLAPGAVILMHSAGGDLSGTVEALPLLLEELQERGLEPVTVSQLFDWP